jgi:hypothetical protein
VADTLSHRDAEHAPEDTVGLGAMCVCSGPSFAFIDDVCRGQPKPRMRRTGCDAWV